MAISDYTKREESDINLKAGNVVDVIERNEHGELKVGLRFKRSEFKPYPERSLCCVSEHLIPNKNASFDP